MIDSTQPDKMAKLVVPHGQCFVLADNRQLTTHDASPFGDSRNFGPIPLADIKGRLAYIYWPVLSWARFGKYRY